MRCQFCYICNVLWILCGHLSIQSYSVAVPSTALPAVSSVMSLTSFPSVSEGHASSSVTLETVYPTLATGCCCLLGCLLCHFSRLSSGSMCFMFDYTTAVPFSTSSVSASTNAVVHSAKQTVAGDTLTCPVCFKNFAFSVSNVLWHHINTDHIS